MILPELPGFLLGLRSHLILTTAFQHCYQSPILAEITYPNDKQTLTLHPQPTKEDPIALPENWKPYTMFDFRTARTFPNPIHNDLTLQYKPNEPLRP